MLYPNKSSMGFFILSYLLLNSIFHITVAENNSKFSILHITDIHLDLEYYPNSPNNCVLGSTGLRCCHKYDIPEEPYKKCSKFGDYNCDTSPWMLNKTYEWIADNLIGNSSSYNIKFISFTGDTVDHHDITQSFSKNVKTINYMGNLFKHYFPQEYVYMTMGNHDTWPIDQTIPLMTTRFLEDISKVWSKWMDQSATETFSIGGYYSQTIHTLPDWRIISFNSLWYDTHNIFKNISQASHNQWKWLHDELTKARLLKQKVIFQNHIPLVKKNTKTLRHNSMNQFQSYHLDPKLFSKTKSDITTDNHEGSFDYSHKLIDIIAEFQDIIVLQLYGHTHHDEFQVYQKNNELVGFSLNGGSLLSDNHDPIFKVIQIENGTVTNFDTYVLNLKEVIETNGQKFNYQKLYSFTELYNVDNITSKSLMKIYNEMDYSNKKISDTLDKYCKYYTPNVTTLHIDNDCLSAYKQDVLISV